MKFSNFFSINLQELIKGFLSTVAGAVWAILAPSIQGIIDDPHHSLNIIMDWTSIWHTGVAVGALYIGSKLFASQPKVVQIDPSKTSVVDSKTKEPIIKAN